MFVNPAVAADFACDWDEETDTLWACCGVIVLRQRGVGEEPDPPLEPVPKLSFLYLPAVMHLRGRDNGYVNQVYQGDGVSVRREFVD